MGWRGVSDPKTQPEKVTRNLKTGFVINISSFLRGPCMFTTLAYSWLYRAARQITFFSKASFTFSGLTSLVKRSGFPAGREAIDRNDEDNETEPRLLRLEHSLPAEKMPGSISTVSGRSEDMSFSPRHRIWRALPTCKQQREQIN